GNDTLNGGAGADILTGGVGSDIFVFRFGQSPVSAADRITDFAIGTDRIDLLSSTGGVLAAPTSFARAANSTTTTLANVVNSVFTDANGAKLVGAARTPPVELNRSILSVPMAKSVILSAPDTEDCPNRKT
ncbi:MAG: M10 family metallopeptidase C-terminal domain-containing protein, partial [Dolichospermum sp.]